MTAPLVVRGGTVVLADRTTEADVVVEGGVITGVVSPGSAAPDGARVVDAGGGHVAPGYLDLQVNGAHGHDLTADPGCVAAVAAALPRYGVTGFCPTIITSPASVVAAAMAAVAPFGADATGAPPGHAGARVLGLHLEGPMLSPDHPGTHPRRHLRPPEVGLVEGWSPAHGVRLVTLAPELDGALDVVDALTDRGVVVSAGHTGATAAQLADAAGRGVRMATHVFNAMAPLHHRAPGAAGAALVDDRVTVGAIVDGVHLDPDIVRLLWRAKGPDGLVLVTDTTAALGAPPGPLRIGDVELTVGADGVRNHRGQLAGSDLSLDRAVRNLWTWTGCSVADAVRTVTSNPADLLGLPLGRIEVGAPADLVVLDAQLGVVETIVGGASRTDRTTNTGA